MSEPDRLRRPQKVLGLFTELLGIGGVQEAGRMTAAALLEMGRASGRPVDILSLNDPRGEQQIRWGDSEIPFSGFGRAKARFVLSAIGKARRKPRQGTPIILAAHPHLALPAAWIQRLRPDFKTVVMSHGIRGVETARFAAAACSAKGESADCSQQLHRAEDGWRAEYSGVENQALALAAQPGVSSSLPSIRESFRCRETFRAAELF